MTTPRSQDRNATRRLRRRAAALCLAFAAALVLARPAAADPVTQTVVLVRHGEKPAQGLGQLNCQGLNRALALPAVIAREFGKPDAIFAPNPAVAKPDNGQPYNYVRPLATIEPTAIAFGLPIDASIGVNDIDALRDRLDAPALRGARVLVAWEHVEIVKLARIMLYDHGGDPALVPAWPPNDFDSIYVIGITRDGAATTATFAHRQEGLNGLPTTCPGQPPA
jgi:hypothetical protein